MIRYTTVVYDVLKKYDLSPIAYMFCDLIYKYTSYKGYCDKTLQDISDILNCSTRSLSRYIPELLEKKLIENIGSKQKPKYRNTPLWFKIAVADSDEVISVQYQEICEDVINYINEKYNHNYKYRTYEKRFKSILSKTFDGEPITGELMVKVFDWCKDNWSEKYQSSVTPEVIFGRKFTEKYLIQYYEWWDTGKSNKDRKNIAII